MWLVKLLSKDGDLSLFLAPPHHVTDVSCVFEPPQTVCGLSERPPCVHMWVVGGYALLAYLTWSTDRPIYRHREYLLNNSFAPFQQRTFSGICTLKREIFNAQNGNSQWLWTFCISHFTQSSGVNANSRLGANHRMGWGMTRDWSELVASYRGMKTAWGWANGGQPILVCYDTIRYEMLLWRALESRHKSA